MPSSSPLLHPDHSVRSTAQRALRISFFDGLAYAVMVGLSESYVPVLAVELGHGPLHLSLLTTLPLLLGAVSQLFAPLLVALLGSRKRFVVLGAAVQALSHVALWHVANDTERALWPLLLAQSVYSIAGLIIAPPWGAWMASLIHSPERERYFAIRSAGVQLVLLVSFLLGGLALSHARETHRLFTAFAWLFAVSLIARMVSAGLLAWQPDPLPEQAQHLRDTTKRIRGALTQPSWRVAAYSAVMMFGAYTSIPFFTPYLLNHIGTSYVEFAVLCSLAILCKAVVLLFCHRIASRMGLRAMLALGGAVVACMPLVWAGFPSLTGLAVSQIIGGGAWALVEYAGFQILLSEAQPAHRIEFLSLTGALAAAAQVLGGFMGSQLLERLHLSYEFVFVISAVGRGLALLILVRLPPAASRASLPS